MSTLLRQILRFLCSHRFSWPHSGIHGQDYQVCLRCGTAFEYDTIRREVRREHSRVLRLIVVHDCVAKLGSGLHNQANDSVPSLR
jgi:hypothetical protein